MSSPMPDFEGLSPEEEAAYLDDIATVACRNCGHSAGQHVLRGGGFVVWCPDGSDRQFREPLDGDA